MNYERIYIELINNARLNPPTGYNEKHHIIPKCFGGDDTSVNIIPLSPEYHLVAHLLLHKIYPDHLGLLTAAVMMSGRNIYNSKQYGWVKRKMSEKATGRINSPETREKLRKAHTGRIKSAEHEHNRVTAMRTPEYREKMRMRKQGIPKTAEENEKNRQAQLRRIPDPNIGSKISAGRIAQLARKKAEHLSL